MSLKLIDGGLWGRKIASYAEECAAAHVSRGTMPVQIGKYQAVCGNPPDPKLPFCAAGGSWAALHATADLAGKTYTPDTIVPVLRSLIPVVEEQWILISASCEEVRKWAIAHQRWVSIDAMPTDWTFLPGMVALMNFEDRTEMAHHYAIITGDDGSGSDEITTVEFNTSDNSQGNGGCVALKRRFLTMKQFRGIVVPIGLQMPVLS